MTKKLDPDRPNKARRGRPRKPKVYKNPNAVAALKAFYASPEGRAKHKASMAAHAAERKLNPEKFSRGMIPNGSNRAKAAPLWAEARRKADRFIQKMTDEGIIPTVLIPDSDDAKGVAALHEACVLALGPTDKQLKLAALRTVLEYTRSKPESKSKVTLNTSEQFLAEIAAEDAANAK